MYELVSHMREKLGDKVTNVVGYGHLGDGECLNSICSVKYLTSELSNMSYSTAMFNPLQIPLPCSIKP